MDLKDSKRMIRIPKTICKEFEERAVDMDIVLPDYCPDVTAILKCIMQPIVTSRHQSGDRYTVDGTVKLRVLYLTEDRAAVHCYESTQPFSAGFRCAGATHYKLEVKNDYVNCRAISPRRMDIHGAFRVYLTAVGEGSTSVFEDPCKRDVFCQKEEVFTTVPLSENEKTLVVDETINLGMQADALLYSDLTVASCERKILTNKAIIKGVLLFKAVFSKDAQLHHTLQELPFSQIVDVDGLSDELVCEADVSIGEHECYLQQNESGASLLFINCKLSACVRCSRRESASVVLDAYSVEQPLVCETTPLQLYDRSMSASARTTFQEFTTLPDTLVSIEDQWGEMKAYEIREDENGKRICCCILVCIIGRDSDGQLGYYERTIDCSTPCDGGVHTAHVRLIGVGCAINGNQIRVQADTEVVSEYASTTFMTVVSDVAVDPKQSFTRPSAAIRIVYACEGETLWDIAKAHHSSVEDIRAENDLTDEYLHAATMLMIPMI